LQSVILFIFHHLLVFSIILPQSYLYLNQDLSLIHSKPSPTPITNFLKLPSTPMALFETLEHKTALWVLDGYKSIRTIYYINFKHKSDTSHVHSKRNLLLYCQQLVLHLDVVLFIFLLTHNLLSPSIIVFKNHHTLFLLQTLLILYCGTLLLTSLSHTTIKLFFTKFLHIKKIDSIILLTN
jgi:hypothetical protein